LSVHPSSGVPTVSVVIIFLNAEKFLREAIESVLAQTFSDWELFLVDDGSSDGSTEIARSYARQHPGKVIYLEHEGHANKGMTASRNLGIAHARGECVAPLDADDVWFPEKLETQVRILREHPDATMVAAPATYWYAEGAKAPQPMGLTPGLLAPGAWIPRILEKDDNTACPSAVLIRTAALRAAGGFESSFKGPLMVFEDQVMWFKMTLSAPVYFHPEPVLLYRIHAASYCASTPSDVQLAGRLVLYTRLAQYIRTAPRAVRGRNLLLQMARARIGELLLRTEPSHREAARALDSSGSVDRQSVGFVLSPVLLAGSISRGKAIALFRKIFDLLFVAYHDGVLSSARALPDMAVSATRSLFPRSQS
jgi:glycosyltransferase involved in cell wall biosynthesis